MDASDSNIQPPADAVLTEIATYVCDGAVGTDDAWETAGYCLMDALGCAIAALDQPECQRHLGPLVPGAALADGVPVPGTGYRLDPVQAAYNIGVLIRWLDYNDTWLAAEWGHPSDNLGAILACADYVSRQRATARLAPLTMREVMAALIKAYEIQGVLALDNSFNQAGIDHVILVKIASCAIATALLGGDHTAVVNALSNAWADGGALRAYRHAPNTGWRKSWAAGDATARAVRLALLATSGEMGYPTILSAPRWGFEEVIMHGQPVRIARPLGSYVVENILFKVDYPGEFHAQTAVECALRLYQDVKGRWDDIDHIVLTTHEAALRIISKTGPLHNPADRDHCLQYGVAIGLLFGELHRGHYSDETASDPRIDRLRELMQVRVEPAYSRDYLAADKRAMANAIAVHFKDGSTKQTEVVYPLGHRRRRHEALPLLRAKFAANLTPHYTEQQIASLGALLLDGTRLAAMPTYQFMDLWPIHAG